MTLIISDLTIQVEKTVLLSNFSLTIPKSDIVTIMGESGCGKSTLLKAIAGQLTVSQSMIGQIYLDHQRIDTLPAHQRNIGYQWQDPCLFPHLCVWENLAFALPKAIKGKQRKERALNTLNEIGLSHLQSHSVANLSGGQKARISVIRTLLAEPKALLLDEPFSALDKQQRIQFREWVFKHIRQQEIPTLLVTHDNDDVPDNTLCQQWPTQDPTC
jgi:putative thiamine transport system ATP-binding protein